MNLLTQCLSLLLFFSVLSVKSQDLNSYRWNNRLFIILSDNPNSPEVRRQMSLFVNDSLALKERKLLLLQVFPTYYLLGSDNVVRRQSGEVYFDYRTEKKPFEVILIGLDGNEKFRKSEVAIPSDIYALIDGMPMRRYEKN